MCSLASLRHCQAKFPCLTGRHGGRETDTEKEKERVPIQTSVKKTKRGKKEREGAREKVQQEQECKRAKDREREGARDIQRNWEQEPERERGERNVLTRRFLSELPKLIISSGLAEPCQEQEPTAKPRPGQALPAPTVTPHPSALPTPPQPPSSQPCSGAE